MAIYILGPDSNGDCCTCAERVNVCDTCGVSSGCLTTPLAFAGSTEPWIDLVSPNLAVATNDLNKYTTNCRGYIFPTGNGSRPFDALVSFTSSSFTSTSFDYAWSITSIPFVTEMIGAVVFPVTVSLDTVFTLDFSSSQPVANGTDFGVKNILDGSVVVLSPGSPNQSDTLVAPSVPAGSYVIYSQTNVPTDIASSLAVSYSLSSDTNMTYGAVRGGYDNGAGTSYIAPSGCSLC